MNCGYGCQRFEPRMPPAKAVETSQVLNDVLWRPRGRRDVSLGARVVARAIPDEADRGPVLLKGTRPSGPRWVPFPRGVAGRAVNPSKRRPAVPVDSAGCRSGPGNVSTPCAERLVSRGGCLRCGRERRKLHGGPAKVHALFANLGGVPASLHGFSANPGGVSANLRGLSASLGELPANLGGVPASLGGVSASLGGVPANLHGLPANLGGRRAGGHGAGSPALGRRAWKMAWLSSSGP